VFFHRFSQRKSVGFAGKVSNLNFEEGKSIPSVGYVKISFPELVIKESFWFVFRSPGQDFKLTMKL
jgi:hypothetical protein